MNSKHNQFPPLPAAWEGRKTTGVLGHGSYGTVYDLEFEDGSHKALKILIGQDKGPSKEVRDAIEKCPYLIDIKEYICENGLSYLLMDLMTPFTEKLSELMNDSFHEDDKNLEKTLIDWMMDLARAISYMEEKQLLHRDIKPENLLIGEDNSCLLGDLDQTRLLGGSSATLSVQGTFRFMAPEVYHGRPYDSRADLYSLGMVFYWCCNRQLSPFLDDQKRFHDQADYEQALRLRMEGTPLPELKSVSEEFSEIILTLCQYAPEDRYQNAKVLLEDLEKLKAGKYRRKKVKQKKSQETGEGHNASGKKSGRKTLIALFALIALMLLGGGLYYQQKNRIVDTRKWDQEGDVTFTLNASGKATFSGNGTVSPYEVPEDWDQLMLKIRYLVVEEGISEFGLSFTNSPVLESLTLEKGVKNLTGFGQFSFCMLLKEVKLPEGLESIGAEAFMMCSSLESIHLPDSIHELPEECFNACSKLSDISCSWDSMQIGQNALTDTAWLRERQEEEGYVVLNGTLLAAPRNQEVVEIPADRGITSLTGGLFAADTQLTKVVLPEGVLRIGEACFSACSNLKEVGLPSTLELIEKEAFQDCTSLTMLEIGEDVDITGGDVFTGSAYFDQVTDSEGFAIVNGVLLAYRGSADEVEIPDGVKVIGGSAFRTNQQIRKVTIPDSVSYISSAAFLMCTNLTEIIVSEDVMVADPSSFGGVPGWNR